MTIVWGMGLCKFLLYNARIGYENTYDLRGSFDFKILVHLSAILSIHCYWTDDGCASRCIKICKEDF